MIDAAQSKTATSPMATLGVNVAGVRVQVAPVGSRTGRARPPGAIRRTRGKEAVGVIVVAGTQELERPVTQLVVVGDSSANSCKVALRDDKSIDIFGKV